MTKRIENIKGYRPLLKRDLGGNRARIINKLLVALGKFMLRILFGLTLILNASFVLANEDIGYVGETGRVFGYEHVEDALNSLKSNKNTEISEIQGWTMISDNENREMWSFPPKSHQAYPSVIRRAVVEKNGQIGIGTQVSCGAKKDACDSLMKDFIELNNQIRKDING